MKLNDTPRFWGRHIMNFEIEYVIKKPSECLWYDNNPREWIDFKFNKKQIRKYKKGIKLTVKYLNKMKRLGFKPEVLEEDKND